MLIKEHLPISDKIYRIAENIPEEVPVEEIDIDSYFFFNILDIASCHNRIIRVSKGLSLSTFAIKKFTFYSQISVQSYFLSSEIHLNNWSFYQIWYKSTRTPILSHFQHQRPV